ncbi:MAG: amidohydrolase family protein [Treponema sp.]|nr:amidohydrolase family protein [Treponema sp.]
MRDTLYHEFLEIINDMPVIDSHEHLVPEEIRLNEKNDFFTIALSHYASSDLVSSGLPMPALAKLRDNSFPFGEKIDLFMPYWRNSSNTAYCRALSIAAAGLYGIMEITPETLPELNKRLAEKNKPGLYKEILQEKLHIKYCLWDQFWLEKPVKDDFFKVSLRLDNIVMINSAADLTALEEKYNVNINSPDVLEQILETAIAQNKCSGLGAIKSALAYMRTLLFEPVSPAEAALSLEKISKNSFSQNDLKKLQDYLMFKVAEKAGSHKLPLQIHTGLFEGNGNNIQNADPSLLFHLIQANPDTAFDLFHGGYPYGGKLSAMAKMFPNVYLDMAWTHIISPSYSVRYLSEWLDTVPCNKIIGFGGDYIFVEGVYGHLQIARQNIAETFSQKISDGIYSKNESLRYAKMILHDNADELFNRQIW